MHEMTSLTFQKTLWNPFSSSQGENASESATRIENQPNKVDVFSAMVTCEQEVDFDGL